MIWPQLPPPQDRETIREWDRRAVEDFGLPNLVLMENAGAGAARLIASLLAEPAAYPCPVVVLCGPGNNGGDGFVVARHLHNAGADVEVHLAFDATALSRDSAAAVNLDVIRKTSLRLFETRPPFPTPQCLRRGKALTVVDALLGTGLSRPLDDPFLTWVRAINGGGFPVLALDVPTGLDANSGEVLGDCVAARHTFSFAAAKLGFYRGSGPKLCGQVHVVDIGMPREIWQTTGVPSRGW